MNRKLLGLLSLCSCSFALAADPLLPEGAPDYSGFNTGNFFDKSAAFADVPAGDYAMPKLDTNRALIVAADGNDTNPGTAEKPFRTLARACKDLRPGAVILLRKGTYVLDPAVRIEGTAGEQGSREQPAVVASYPGEIATLLGCAPVSGWTRLEGTSIFHHDFTNAPNGPAAVWFNDRMLPSTRHFLAATMEKPPFQDKNLLPLEGATPLSAPGTWALKDNRMFLRAPSDADPNNARVEISLANKGNGSITMARSEWVIFDRLAFRKHAQAVTCASSPYAIFRQCLFDNCSYGITFHGGDAAERGIVDRCMFDRIGDGAHGEAIYNTAPMTIRYCLFRDVGPLISIAAYTSKNDMFSGLKVIGNTFLHGGACVTSTGKGSLIQNNVALGSRFLSSAGSDARIEGNVAVYDPRDLAEWPSTPRRNIGFRLYGKNAKLWNNTFIGFAQGGNIYKPEGGDGNPAPVEARGNKFYGFTQYALRIHDPDNLTSSGNLFVPAGTNTTVVYLTPTQTNKVPLTLSEWQCRGFDSNSLLHSTSAPTIPNVIREAMK